MPERPTLGVLDPLPFGKLRNVALGTAIEDEPRYVRWLVEEAGLTIDADAMGYLKENESS